MRTLFAVLAGTLIAVPALAIVGPPVSSREEGILLSSDVVIVQNPDLISAYRFLGIGTGHLRSDTVKIEFDAPCIVTEDATYRGVGSDGNQVLVRLTKNFGPTSIDPFKSFSTNVFCGEGTLFWVSDSQYRQHVHDLKVKKDRDAKRVAANQRRREAVRRLLSEEQRDRKAVAEAPWPTTRP